MAIWQYLSKGLCLYLAVPLQGIDPIHIFSTYASDMYTKLFITTLFVLAREGEKLSFHQRQFG